jgi:hypothetical protein
MARACTRTFVIAHSNLHPIYINKRAKKSLSDACMR